MFTLTQEPAQAKCRGDKYDQFKHSNLISLQLG
ncbi:MAG: hypothetical protein H6Q37_503 [Chloroflexi bacterium]|nr:hypothetical protein [Chloroflexota bacterium]